MVSSFVGTYLGLKHDLLSPMRSRFVRTDLGLNRIGMSCGVFADLDKPYSHTPTSSP